jgi:hypothetical protein
MCFSAAASFVASGILGTVGVIAVSKTKTASFRVLSGIPLLFSVQQFTEGFVWLSLQNPDYTGWQPVPVFIFLAIALVIWPVIVPLSVLLPEKKPVLKKILAAFLVWGIIIAGFMLYYLLFTDVSASMLSFRVHYSIGYPVDRFHLYGLFYFVPTVVPLFLSSVKRIKLFGLVMLASYIVTHIFFRENVISVWCFFAALISIVIIVVIIKANKGLVR